ncbi:MAG: MFS transporter, partial [Chloroflexi bacterium]|nr:MFS transporter [Chloroflexota bacterium]
MSQQLNVAQAKRRFRIGIPPAMRYPAYRQYWFGTLASVSGFQMFTASQFWLIHKLEESPLFLGYVGLANAIPAIALNLFGGVFADKLNQRRLIMTTQTIVASLIFLLATLTLTGVVNVWHVLGIAFITGAVNAFDQPARQALYPHLIERKVMTSAVALNSSIWQGTRIVAPAVAGLIIGFAGIAESFYVAGAGFLAMAIVIAMLSVPRIERGATAGTGRSMLEGVKFIKGNSIFSFLIGMTFFNSFFGMAYVVMMPVFAEDILGQGPSAYGAL